MAIRQEHEQLTGARPMPENCRFIQHVSSTPLVSVELPGTRTPIWCKLEFLNPSGSTKDRIARYILEKQWRAGRLKQGDGVVEASSGSTSIALALACAQMQLKFTAVMPDTVSKERIMIIRSYGGEVLLIPSAEGIVGAINKAQEIADKTGAYCPRQFENPDNAEAHRVSTGQEILRQVPGSTIDAVVSGVGTGGTLVGLYNAFAEAGCPVKPFLARPIQTSMDFDVECCSFSSKVPGVVDGLSRLYNEASLPQLQQIDITDELALNTTRELIRHGFPVGPSSGLNYAAAAAAALELGPGATIITVFPDRMERYFSTELFNSSL